MGGKRSARSAPALACSLEDEEFMIEEATGEDFGDLEMNCVMVRDRMSSSGKTASKRGHKSPPKSAYGDLSDDT